MSCWRCAIRRRARTAAASLAGPGSTSVVELDLSDLEQIAGCAETLLARHDHVAALICNAGVMGGPWGLSAQGFERQMATNHLGHVALVAGLSRLLRASASRVVLVSSTEARDRPAVATDHTRAALAPGARRRAAGLPQHQTGQPALRTELHRRCVTAGSSISAVTAHPGASATNLFARQLDQAGLRRLAPRKQSRLDRPCCSRLPPAPCRFCGQWTDSTPSGAFVGPARFAQFRGRPELLEALRLCEEPGDRCAPVGTHQEALGEPLVLAGEG